MAHRQSSIEYFVERVEGLAIGDVQVGASGLWEIKVERILVPTLQATAIHPAIPAVQFRADSARDLAWKLIGVQVNMKPFSWDLGGG